MLGGGPCGLYAALTLARAAMALALGRLDRVEGVSDRDVGEVVFSGADIRMQVDGDRIEGFEVAPDHFLHADLLRPPEVYLRRVTAPTG